MISLVLGGRRSGKSAWAEKLALKSARAELVYIATCPKSDLSMRERISSHQKRRETQHRAWVLIEEPLELAKTIKRVDSEKTDCLLFIDCITLWLSNLLESKTEAEIRLEVSEFCRVLGELKNDAVLISNEVGLGLAPATELGNKFIDLAGFANQEIAQIAHEVAFVAAGLPLYLKK